MWSLAGLRDSFEFTRHLGFRLGLLLSVAVLPLGLISVIQTMHMAAEVQRAGEVALLGRTSAAASGERGLLQSALGTADALGPAILELLNRPEECSDTLRAFKQRGATYASAGFTPLDGKVTCSTADGPFDATGSVDYQSFIKRPATMVTPNAKGIISGESVIVVSQPLYRDSELLGYVSISLTTELLESTHVTNTAGQDARILTFNDRGQILTSDSKPGIDPMQSMPVNRTLVSLVAEADTTFRAQSNDDEQRVYSVVPVVPGLVYALGSWSPGQAGQGGFVTALSVLLLPLILWAASLVVAYIAVDRLVLRHIRELRGQMRRFAVGDRDTPPRILREAPAEIADVSQTFHNMARILIRDEEQLEASVDEKTVLLKEVHHRVKNNLQLIASIISMQSRAIDNADARRVLRSVQDRVSSLATIYRNLYQAEHLDAVEADRLLSEIISKMATATANDGSKLRLDTDLAPLTLVPDQAVPLSLLATEAFTNAMKYVSMPEGQTEAWVSVRLSRGDDGTAMLEIRNSIGAGDTGAEGTGLGSQLIEAFATQLNSEVEVVTEGDEFVLRLTMKVEEPHLRTDDDSRQVVLTSAARQGATH
ncbi:sensor histidine kinase [Paracoccus pacificus]|uniref:histidine kinase n=1 Tax=Paracoccus pacificus TaxID=1463598 RepID=A0ABW4R702_9RHOB